MSVPKLLVVGGNGFLGSAICKSAVAKGWDVSSMSASGRPYATPAGHTPKWVDKVSWHAASAFDPSSYRSLLADSTAVVHTLGILLEDAGYKDAVRSGNVLSLVKAFAGGVSGGRGNPLKSEEERRRGYDGMNRDTALTVLDTFLSTSTPTPTPSTSSSIWSKPTPEPSSLPPTPSKPFVYISAADAFRPVVPERYIASKREAEFEILRRTSAEPDAGIRPLFIRPGLMYHPHIRPISTLPAFLLSLTASLPFPNPFASKSILGGAVDALSTHPIHVDHVASAVIRAIEDEGTQGVVDLDMMRRWAGFDVRNKAGEPSPLQI